MIGSKMNFIFHGMIFRFHYNAATPRSHVWSSKRAAPRSCGKIVHLLSIIAMPQWDMKYHTCTEIYLIVAGSWLNFSVQKKHGQTYKRGTLLIPVPTKRPIFTWEWLRIRSMFFGCLLKNDSTSNRKIDLSKYGIGSCILCSSKF